MKDLIIWSFVPESITYGLESVMVEIFRGVIFILVWAKLDE
jgi:hypothetical protein